jgi:hypothetical protein
VSNVLGLKGGIKNKFEKKPILSVWAKPEGPNRARQPGGQARRGPSGQARGRRGPDAFRRPAVLGVRAKEG